MNFLKADWRKLVMVNYVIDPAVLLKYLPAQTELDLWNDRCYVSLVGFMFINTNVLGLKIPFHIDFEEVNLRFYVKHKDALGEWKRGVTFIKEIVDKPAITFIANTLYKEKYETLPTRHDWILKEDFQIIEYKWKKNKWHGIQVKASNVALDIKNDSEEEFISEHYWGYTKVSETKTSEYEVSHPKWQVYEIKDYKIDVDFEILYGVDFKFLNHQNPSTVFLAEGSDIVVKGKRTL